ncbi:MAG: hypothetical protein LDL11_08050 [Desulfarculus sp.]|nr:hypothetical protein [Desulfarculus sp.]
MSQAWIKWTTGWLLGGCLLAGLGGCFDYSVDLSLAETGRGTLEVSLDLPVEAASGQDIAHLDTIVLPVPTRERAERDGRLTVREQTSFDFLDDLAARRMIIRLDEIGTGIVGLGDYAYRLTATMEMAEGDLPDREVLPGVELEKRQVKPEVEDLAARRARELRARSLAGHHLTFAVTLPGRVETARPLILGHSRVEATTSRGGARVEWKVPLAVLFNENWRSTLTFSLDFKGYTTFRSYEQKYAASHHPDAYDEALARGENPPGGRKRYLELHPQRNR